jgi:HTH-type transcriptional regulator, sugar sensing transcriptional regulator
MDLKEVLENIGFNEKEAKVYLALLELREALPSTIAKKAGIKRPTTYVILEQLKARGVVTHVKQRNLTYFQALSPATLLASQEDKYLNLKNSLPSMMSLHEKYTSTPQMQVFEGKEGLIQIWNDTLNATTDLLCWADIDNTADYCKEYGPEYVKKRVGKNIWVRAIYNDSPLAEYQKTISDQELREIYTVPKEKFPFDNEINIYDDKVSIISHHDEIGVIIQNKAIADTQRSIFKFGFEYAKLLAEST